VAVSCHKFHSYSFLIIPDFRCPKINQI
jgi:hypothetical protein